MLSILLLCLLQSDVISANTTAEEYFLNVIVNGISSATTYQLPTDAKEYEPTDTNIQPYGEYDFIIVGSGVSGSVLAARLATVSQWRILVLEAGGYEDDFSQIPGMHYYGHGTKYNWGFKTVPQQKSCLAQENQRCESPRGKGFGGTSIINVAIYSRSKRADHENMVAAGNTMWDYPSVIPYYKRSENCLFAADPQYRGFSGEMDVVHHFEPNPQLDAYILANKELGIDEIDTNGPNSFGVNRVQSTLKNGRKWSAYRWFLEPVSGQSNIDLSPHSYVIKVELENMRAKSVIFSRNGTLYRASATKEIILSAGAYQTPQLLMLSGVGPRNHLRQVGIKPLKNLPVGNNLRDHPGTFAMMFQTNSTFEPKALEDYIKEYLNGTGFFTIPANVHAIGFYSSSNNDHPNDPDVELIMLPSPSYNDYLRKYISLTEESFNTLFGNVDPTHTIAAIVVLLHPKSQGTIRLKSSDPYEYPLIDTRFFTDKDDHDLETVYSMVDFLKRLEETDAFQEIGAQFVTPNVPQCSQHQTGSRDYWRCVIQYYSFHVFHPTGTAKMGPKCDCTTVVDQKFRVHGVKALRVVDASVFPFSFGAHLAAPCLMIGERAFDFIKDQYPI